jgi:hypothetical protein
MLQLTFEQRVGIAVSAALDTDEDLPVHDFPALGRKPARWWQLKARHFEARLDLALQLMGLPTVTQEMRDIYWAEVRKGQSVYEDAGGYLWRCWRAAFDQSVNEPYTYDQVIADLKEAAK